MRVPQRDGERFSSGVDARMIRRAFSLSPLDPYIVDISSRLSAAVPFGEGRSPSVINHRPKGDFAILDEGVR